MSQLPSEHNDYIGVEEINEFDFRRIAGTLWIGRYTILSVAFFGLLTAVIFLHIAVYSYTATLMLVPSESQTQSPSDHLAGLASLAGVNLGQGQSISPFSEYPKVMVTRDVAENLIKRSPKLIEKTFESEWNARTNSWEEPRGLFSGIKHAVKAVLGIPIYAWHPPGSEDVQEFISENVKLSEDTEKPILTLRFSAPDPEFAKSFLTELNKATDLVLRRSSLDRASKYAAYLEKKLSSVQNTDLRQVLMQSLSAQETMIMMGSSDTSFAVQEIGEATTPMRPSSPQPKLVILLGILMGSMLGGFLAYFNLPVFGILKVLVSRVREYWRTTSAAHIR